MNAVLDIPVPPSVNRTRKINRAALDKLEAWQVQCDRHLMASGQYRVASANRITGQFALHITLCEQQCRMDLDNVLKAAIDYLRRVELIPNDDPAHFRKLMVEWGDAPKGCRLTLMEIA